VRWADVDLVGIMRFSAFTRLVELAEQELLREAGMAYDKIFDAPTVIMPRRHRSIDYFSPARIDDALTLVTYVSRLGETSLTLNVDVRSSTRWTLIASAAMVVVCVTTETFAKRPLPTMVRDALAPFACSAEVARGWTPARP
jgi:YbgC/YbaW family acyl-CoA thioester hydrolase